MRRQRERREDIRRDDDNDESDDDGDGDDDDKSLDNERWLLLATRRQHTQHAPTNTNKPSKCPFWRAFASLFVVSISSTHSSRISSNHQAKCHGDARSKRGGRVRK